MTSNLSSQSNISRKQILQDVKRVVVKIGSRVLASLESGLDLKVMNTLAQDMLKLRQQGHEVIIVSSGAVLAGRTKLGPGFGKGFGLGFDSVAFRQAAAAVGQTSLMRHYEKIFGQEKVQVAQLLLTHDDIGNRRRYLNARNTIFTLLRHAVVPIINENDTVVVEEIKLGDNDNLSALVTSLAEADLLIILSDVDGLCSTDPSRDDQACLIGVVEQITPEIEQLAGKGRKLGIGGMVTKLQAAQKVVSFGVPVVIANGRRPGILGQIMQGDEVGTLFLPRQKGLPSRKHWIAHALKPKGKIVVDDGAKRALVENGKSLLPSGILRVEGRFGVGDMVSCTGLDGAEIARGLTNYHSHEIEQIQGRKTHEIKSILSYKSYDEVIHRDNLVLV
jgi:glutamate 5-kinase